MFDRYLYEKKSIYLADIDCAASLREKGEWAIIENIFPGELYLKKVIQLLKTNCKLYSHTIKKANDSFDS